MNARHYAVLLLTGALSFGCPAAPTSPLSIETQESQDLLQALIESGTPSARLFIAIDLAVQPEAALATYQDQRDRIFHTQETILQGLGGSYDVASLSRYKTLPALALRVDHDGLQILADLLVAHALAPDLREFRVALDPRMVPHAATPLPLEESLQLTGVRNLPPELRGAGQIIVVIDDGVSEGYDILAEKVAHGGFITSNELVACHGSPPQKSCFEAPEDGYPLLPSPLPPPPIYPNHGSQMAAIACGRSGVASQARCFSIRVADSSGAMLFSDVIEALEVFYTDWSGNYPLSVVSLSLGVSQLLFSDAASCVNSTFGPATQLACQNLVDKNIPVVVSAGNAGSDTSVAFPACLEEVVTVGATTKVLISRGVVQRSPISNWGPLVDVTAPGVNMIAPVNNYIFGFSPGTSIAAPQVAGVLALLRQANTTCLAEFLRRSLEESPVMAGTVSGMGERPFLSAADALRTLGILCPGP